MNLHAPNLPNTNYNVTEDEGLTYNPQPSDPTLTTTITGNAYHTHHALEGPNILWIEVMGTLTQSTAEATPSYKTVISLYGLNDNQTEELIGEKIYPTIDSTPTTTPVAFNLINSSCQPPLVRENRNLTYMAPEGQIQLNLPFRYENYETIQLNYHTTPLSPISPDDDLDYCVFTTPSTWVESTPISCTIKEWYGEEYTTNNISTSTRDIIRLGYDGLDKYNTLRIKIETTTNTTPYMVSFNNLSYKYEVL